MRCRSLPRTRSLIPALLGLLLTAASAQAAAVAGFVETWPAGIGTWGGGVGQITITNPGTGGFQNDGYLRIARTTSGNFGVRSFGSEYLGDWDAAGIERVSVRLRNLGEFPLEIHFSLGGLTNLWQSDLAFIPGFSWGEFTVDLTDSASFTNIIGPGSYQFALQHVEVVHIRHDLPTFVQTPDPTVGVLGIDHLALLASSVGVPPAPGRAASPVAMAPPSPNPSRGPVALTLRVADASTITVRVVDAQGRVVRSARLEGGAGTRVWTWDGRDDAGRVAPAGVYRAQAWSAAGGTSRSLVRVR